MEHPGISRNFDSVVKACYLLANAVIHRQNAAKQREKVCKEGKQDVLAEFEEKQYEQHLNIELLEGTNLIFPPGQHLENVLGFDAALFTTNREFWRHFLGGRPWYRRFFRSYLNGLYFPEDAYHIQDAIDNDFPKIKFNAFIQHKRPERMVKDTAAEWSSWNQEYYRYKILGHQQKILEELEKNIGNEGVVTYASPAFHTKKQFWEVHKNRAFVESSNFCQPHKLINHDAYTYTEAGAIGIAHSDPESIQSMHLLSEIDRLTFSDTNSNLTNSEIIKNTSLLIEKSLEVNKEQYSLYNQIINELRESQRNYPEIFINLYKISVFKFVSGINLYFGVEPSHKRHHFLHHL